MTLRRILVLLMVYVALDEPTNILTSEWTSRSPTESFPSEQRPAVGLSDTTDLCKPQFTIFCCEPHQLITLDRYFSDRSVPIAPTLFLLDTPDSVPLVC